MSWSVPRTWVNGEVPTAAMLNGHMRDNETIVKVARDSLGRITALSSTYLADLSSSNLTGLARGTAANSFTAGRTRLLDAARIVVPVGTDKFAGSAGNKTAGSVWVEGDYLHHVDAGKDEWRYLGDLVGTPAGAKVGSLWLDDDAYLHYIDSSGEERKVVWTDASPHADTAALIGSTWIEGDYLHWITAAANQERIGHADAHGDGTPHQDSHSDTSHSDSHTDVAHSDSHGDVAHSDSHSDTHGDGHGDDELPHIDTHSDFHNDTHGDSHTDSHSDSAHSDTHGDVTHVDTHNDHSDHNDTVHQDKPELIGA